MGTPPTFVVEDATVSRFELALPGGAIAAAYYRIDDDGRVVLTHTEVPSEFSGQGVATRLATGVFNLLRGSRRQVIVKCGFMAHFSRKHPEYDEMIAG